MFFRAVKKLLYKNKKKTVILEKCGSCWAFASEFKIIINIKFFLAVATVESAYAVNNFIQVLIYNLQVAHGELRNLSEQELLDCNLENNACNGGNVDKAFQLVLFKLIELFIGRLKIEIFGKQDIRKLRYLGDGTFGDKTLFYM